MAQEAYVFFVKFLTSTGRLSETFLLSLYYESFSISQTKEKNIFAGKDFSVKCFPDKG